MSRHITTNRVTCTQAPPQRPVQARQQAVQQLTQQSLDEARGLTERENLCIAFCEMFLESEKHGLDSTERKPGEQWPCLGLFDSLRHYRHTPSNRTIR